ncbi:MAG: DUF1292 domain-containing protein [Thermotogae bacterium]|nr:DUF1292 domain-containing protein [Thermotogota bacterium]MCP5465062.1 DUF1292 domain-containing protein [Thermotogota bacterium]HOO75019.1 DUF1292 domain-containing protein [Tepiditoga sp.]
MDENELEFFTIMGDDEKEYHFLFVAELELEGKKYWICDEAFPDEDTDEMTLGETVVFKVTTEGDDFFLDSIEDEEEYNRVYDFWESNTDVIDTIDEDAEYEEENEEDEKDM